MIFKSVCKIEIFKQGHVVKVLICFAGSLGQLGVEVAKFLRNIYGRENVIMSDIIKPSKEVFADGKMPSFLY